LRSQLKAAQSQLSEAHRESKTQQLVVKELASNAARLEAQL
jgi:hypothetical protein